MTNKEIKQLISTIESTLVSKQNQISRDQYNLKYKNSIIDTQAVKIETLQNENINLNEEIDRMDSFECFIINVLDNEDLTDTDKIKLIREKI